MAKPTYVGTYPANTTPTANWGTTADGATRQTDSFSVLGGDRLIVFGGAEGYERSFAAAGPSGGSLTWTKVEDPAISGNFCRAAAWTATVDTGKTMSVSLVNDGDAGTRKWGFIVQHWRDSDGFGAAESSTAANSAPSRAITTTQANSGLAYFGTDWDAIDGASRTWRTINSITPTSGNGLEKLYFRDSAFYTIYSAIWDDVGAIGAKTTGLSAPSTCENSMIAIEVKGSTSGVGVTVTVACGAMTSSVGQVVVPANVVSPTGNEMVASVGQVTTTGVAFTLVDVTGQQMTASVGTAVAPHDAAVVASPGMTASVGIVSVVGGAIGPPAFRASTNSTYAALQYSTTLTKPTGTVENDILLALLFRGRGTPDWTAITLPSGFTQIGTDVDIYDGTGFYARSAIWWKRAGGSEPADYTWSHLATTSSTQGYLAAYSGCPTSGDPVDVFSSNSMTSPVSGTTATGLSVTTTQANDMLAYLSHNWEGSGTLSPPSGMTERFDSILYSADQVLTASGATGNRTMTHATVAPWAVFMVALKGVGEEAGTGVTVDVTGQSITAEVGSVTVTVPGGITVACDAMTASVGTVTIAAVQHVAVEVGGQELAIALGSVTIQTGASTTAPVFRHLTSVAYAAQPTGIMTVDKPTGTAEGDILIATLASGSSSTTDLDTAMTPPSGFATIGTPTIVTQTGGGYHVKQFVLWKRAGASEPSTYTFNHDAVGTMGGTVAMAAYYDCIDTGDPVDVFSQNSATTGTTATGTSITTTQDKTKLINIAQNWEGSGALSPPSGMTERFDGIVYLADEDRPSAGATGNRTQTLASNEPWQSYLIALKPGSSGSPAITVGVGGQSMTLSVGQVTVGQEVVQVTGQQITASVGSVTTSSIGSVPVAGQEMTASVGQVTVSAGSTFAWSPASLSGGGSLALQDQRFTVVAPVSSSNVTSFKSYGTGLHYAETTFTGGAATGYFGLYNVASDTGVMIDLDTGQVLQRPSGTLTSVFAPIVDGDTVGIAYDGDAGKVWFRVNGGDWNNNAAHTPEAESGIGLSEPPPTAGYSGTLTAYSGSQTITTAGTLIENKNISVMLLVRANNVTIRNCYIHNSDSWGIDADAIPAVSGLVVDHCTIDGGKIGGNSCILTCNNTEVTNCDLMGYDNGIMLGGDNLLLEGNYIHELGRIGGAGEAHVDGIQSGGGSGYIIRGNWIESWDTSCIILKCDYSAIDDVLIEGNNLLNDPDDGLVAANIYCKGIGANAVTNVIIRNNRMEEPNGYYLDHTDSPEPLGENNVDYDTGDPILTELDPP